MERFRQIVRQRRVFSVSICSFRNCGMSTKNPSKRISSRLNDAGSQYASTLTLPVYFLRFPSGALA
jgi:hypothetical protein